MAVKIKYSSGVDDPTVATMLIRHAEHGWARLLAFVTDRDRSSESAGSSFSANPSSQRPGSCRRTCPARSGSPDSELRTLAEISKRLGRKLLSDVACVAKPETILGWYLRLIARKGRWIRQWSEHLAE